MDNAICVENLVKHFGEVKAVDGISFNVEKGELFGFLGVNGAGKTTTINMLCTLYSQDSGEAELCGYKLGSDNNKIRENIGVVFQNNSLDGKLTVRQNLMTRGYLYEKNRDKIKENLSMVCDFLDIGDIMDRKYQELSGGQKRKCEIARAIMNRPDILFLDEPTTGLDPQTRRLVWQCIERLRREQSMTIFLTTHYMEEAARARHVAIIDSGKIVTYGTPTMLKQTYASDRIRVYSDNYERVTEIASKYGLEYKEKSNHMTIYVTDTLSAIPVLEELKPWITAFEVVQGTMDDVFIEVTGKQLPDA
jgi:multidrug/hemolysin transport system ATP-binding protein